MGEHGQAVLNGFLSEGSIMRNVCPPVTLEAGQAVPYAVRKGQLTYPVPAGNVGALPIISGTVALGEELTVHVTGMGFSAIAYAWKRDGVNITGGTGNTYTPVDADLGKFLNVTVSGMIAGSAASRTAAAVGTVGNPGTARFAGQGSAIADAPDYSFTGGSLTFDTLTTDVHAVSIDLLQDSGIDLEREIVRELADMAAPALNKVYTNGYGSAVIPELTEGSALKPHAGTAVDNPYAADLIRALMLGLHQDMRRGSRLMVSDGGYWGFVRSGGRDSVANVVREGVESTPTPFSLEWPGHFAIANPDMLDFSGDRNGRIQDIPDKAVLLGNYERFYRIYDAGDMVIERYTDSVYAKRRQVGFALHMRTAARLIGPDGCVIYFNEQ